PTNPVADNRGEWFDSLWGEMRKEKADLVDEHYYAPPEWFLRNAGRYDDYDRNDPKVFAGEYAAHGPQGDDPSSRNTWLSALAEAAFMTGLERNADVVQMASYAPLFAHVEAWQWRPDLIWFDNLNVVGTPNYYVQKLFSTNKGDRVVRMLENGSAVSGQDSLYAGAVSDRAKGELIFKIVNTSSKAMPVEISLKSGRFTGKSAVLQTLASDDLTLYNSIENPLAIYPGKSELRVDGNRIPMQAPPRSLSVIRVKTGK
ncbi:MAG TPA: alpha-L-arabinofuranosidase C-terminal domain-containing protein, partial [Flavilitoribacter sp.]|nr:alpha-L-arabinofuranosidase C-terminal domain-containing protein [Flavilitoribacter sp.]